MRWSPGRVLVPVAVAFLVLAPAAMGGDPARAEPRSGGAHLAALPEIKRPVVVSTVPPVPGFPVILDGVTHVTDGQGKASFDTVPVSKETSGRFTAAEAVLPLGGRQVKVTSSRFSPAGREPIVWLNLSYQVHFDFATIHGAPVDVSSIRSTTVKSVTGETVDVPPGQDAWLRGVRVVTRQGKLEVKKISWSVQQVVISGSNVVHTAQQRFVPADQATVPLKLLFYTVDLRVHDAVFGFPTGRAVHLVYPDGHAQRLPLDNQGHVHLRPLPRGNYTVTVDGPGPAMSRPLSISRSQRLDLALYSWPDLALFFGVLLVLAGGLLWWGRSRRRRHRHVTSAAAGEPDPGAGPSPDESSPESSILSRQGAP